MANSLSKKKDDALLAAVGRGLAWFRNSGVMDPADGKWGVAERVVVAHGNAALENIKAAFHAWTPFDGYCVIEQRRADCNFQTAWLFLLAADAFGNAEYRAIGENLLYFLYCRSGLLMQYEEGVPHDLWQWSHIRQVPQPYFDDNSWCLFIELAIADRWPELGARYGMREQAEKLAAKLLPAMRRTFRAQPDARADRWSDPAKIWLGNMYYPHWCSLSIMALSAAYRHWPSDEAAQEIRRWSEFVDGHIAEWNTSELGYAILGAACAARAFPHESWYGEHLSRLGTRLLAKQDPATGNFASEHDAETPAGPHLVDTIYTVNWVFPALQCLGDPAREARAKLRELLLKIQDDSPEKQFSGCWRGMYDLNARSWGGGDRYEGGANSIYTGWTNAPIGIWLLAEREGKCLADLAGM